MPVTAAAAAVSGFLLRPLTVPVRLVFSLSGVLVLWSAGPIPYVGGLLFLTALVLAWMPRGDGARSIPPAPAS